MQTKTSINAFLGSTSKLIKLSPDSGDNLSMFVQFQFHPSDSADQIETDEAEVIFAFDDGFGVPANSNSLPDEWRISPKDPEGNALYKIPKEACIAFQHRKLRRRRYHGNIRVRKFS